MLSFAGITLDLQARVSEPVIVTEVERPHPRRQALSAASPNDPSRCVVLVPHTGQISPVCGEGLRELVRRGYQVCNERFGRPLIPFFQPAVRADDDGSWYLAEDWAFCDRSRHCGYPMMADTTIRVWHLGTYAYGWEDVAKRDRPKSALWSLDELDGSGQVYVRQTHGHKRLMANGLSAPNSRHFGVREVST